MVKKLRRAVPQPEDTTRRDPGPSLDHRNMPTDLGPIPDYASHEGRRLAYGFEINGKFYLWRYTLKLLNGIEIVDHSSHDLREALHEPRKEHPMLSWVGDDLIIDFDKCSVRYNQIVTYVRQVVRINPSQARSVQ